MLTVEIPKRPKRQFIDEDLNVKSWSQIERYFITLLDANNQSVDDLEQWMLHRSELEAVLEEELAWRYIKMNIDTTDETLSKAFQFWISEIVPKVAPYTHQLNLKVANSPLLDKLDQEKYRIYLRGLHKSIDIFREENIPLFVKLETMQQEYGAIAAKMTVEIDGQQVTMQKAAQQLKDNDRSKRKEVYDKMCQRRAQDVKRLDDLFDALIAIRQEIAQNAGFDNFRDYKFAALGRFDYSPSDCFDFHQAIQEEIVPLVESFDLERKEKLQLDSYKPWDTAVDTDGRPPLKPFNDGADLIDKSIRCLERLKPYYGQCLSIMKAMKHMDLESKEGKAPGGFNYPLYEIGVPFIYMNAVGSQRDLVTMVHEGGHAIHSFLSRDLPLCEFKSTPSEVAELASMSMELLSMDAWDEFYSDDDELKRAKTEQMHKVLEGLPWIAAIDKFQHWIYTTQHTADERREQWVSIMSQFGSSVVDWQGQEDALNNLWQKQLHLYEVPFYYIEYGMAQLGAIAMWRSFKQTGPSALDAYDKALKLGYTKSINEIYQTAGIEFSFTSGYVKELAGFIKSQL
ncbi:MAG: M3 family oligoendopeptidase [Bacteroidota bacterium]|nr:M3 family oligoendopeptidase [Bacteroidota bacterium]